MSMNGEYHSRLHKSVKDLKSTEGDHLEITGITEPCDTPEFSSDEMLSVIC